MRNKPKRIRSKIHRPMKNKKSRNLKDMMAPITSFKTA